MASEGLDIPSLTTEFLISPKTDIVQSVGRILRAKHATTQPVIYDFVDTHDVFQRQWLKRKAFYKKQNYKIVGADNSNPSSWTTIFDPKPNNQNKKCQIPNGCEAGEEAEEEKDVVGSKCFFKPMKSGAKTQG